MLVSKAEAEARICYLISEGLWTKVGITKTDHSLHRRLQNLQSGNARKLTIKHQWTFHHDMEAYNYEQKLLDGLSTYRADPDSEWVCLTPRQIIHFVETGECTITSHDLIEQLYGGEK